MDDYFEYAVPTDSDYWTHESDDVPSAFFDRVESELKKYVSETLPGVEFSIRFVPDTMSLGNRSRSSLDDERHADILDSIDNWMSTRWPDWLAETDG